MQSRLTHRGPDDRGLVALDNDRCVLAHTRLSILDLSPAGHQPMSTPNERYWITYNGEIYNFKELRNELGGPEVGGQKSEVNSQRPEIGREQSSVAGHPSTVSDDAWRSNSDTEVILRAYERWGLGCLGKFRGMFAFAIWDNQKEELILARDPYGIKPLYYYQNGNTFNFASEVRALLASGLVPRKLSRDGLLLYLQFGSVQDPLTIVDGIRSVLPGHCLVVKHHQNTISLHQYPFLSSHIIDSPVADRPEAVIRLRTILEESVRAHLVSDVPVGAFLSGGIDSSGIVALMSRVADQKPKTFSVVFKESEFSEAAHAQNVAKTFGTEHREILLSEDHLLSMLPDAFSDMDQPTMDGVNSYVISKAVKEAGITVALSGLGGDELFAGYPSFRRAGQLRKMAMLPQACRNAAAAVGRAFLNGSARNQKLWDLVESNCTSSAAYNISRRLFAPNEISALISDRRPLNSDLWPSAPSSLLPAGGSMPFALSPLQHQDVINEVSRLELSGYMTNTLLRDTDQMSMAHALEVRVPFIDSAVVSFVLGLPGEWKLNGSRPKPLLLDALGDLLPEEIWRRPKMGFTLPFQKWMRSALQPELDKTLSGGYGTPHFGIDAKHMRHTWSAFKQNPSQQPWSRSWALYVLKKWCETNSVTAD